MSGFPPPHQRTCGIAIRVHSRERVVRAEYYPYILLEDSIYAFQRRIKKPVVLGGIGENPGPIERLGSQIVEHGYVVEFVRIARDCRGIVWKIEPHREGPRACAHLSYRKRKSNLAGKVWIGQSFRDLRPEVQVLARENLEDRPWKKYYAKIGIEGSAAHPGRNRRQPSCRSAQSAGAVGPSPRQRAPTPRETAFPAKRGTRNGP